MGRAGASWLQRFRPENGFVGGYCGYGCKLKYGLQNGNVTGLLDTSRSRAWHSPTSQALRSRGAAAQDLCRLFLVCGEACQAGPTASRQNLRRLGGDRVVCLSWLRLFRTRRLLVLARTPGRCDCRADRRRYVRVCGRKLVDLTGCLASCSGTEIQVYN